jgi:uncharacterized repeat protein (TIGR03803 family)
MRHVGSTFNRRNWFAGARPSAVTGALAFAVALLLSLSAAPLLRAQNYTVIYSFQCGPNDGQYPEGNLIADPAGNLYGTTQFGGSSATSETYGDGTVFELSPEGTEAILHNFLGSPGDGSQPVAGLVRDAAGDLFGTTYQGGTIGYGTVFEIPAGGVETLLHSFANEGDDGFPQGSLLLDSNGNLYGTTAGLESASDAGTVFNLAANGKITELHSFPAFAGDGENPVANLIRDSAGNLYGVTEGGGALGFGTVFEVSKGKTETVLYSFEGGSDGEDPRAGLARDPEGNLYGTTDLGGGNDNCFSGILGCGTVFKVTPGGQETVLYAFTGKADGGIPDSDLVLDPKGNLYGTAGAGGLGSGVVFELTSTGKEKVLHSFTGYPDDGSAPGGLLRVGNYFYGTTYMGGTYDCGTVYKVAP